MQHPSPPAADRDPRSRLEQLRSSDEDGAQAVEYAVVGAMGVGLITALWTLIQKTGIIEKIIEALVSGLVDLLTGWF